MRWLVGLLLALGVAASAGAGAARAEVAGIEKTQIVIAVGGVSNQVDKLAFGVAKALHCFQDEGLDPEPDQALEQYPIKP